MKPDIVADPVNPITVRNMAGNRKKLEALGHYLPWRTLKGLGANTLYHRAAFPRPSEQGWSKKSLFPYAMLVYAGFFLGSSGLYHRSSCPPHSPLDTELSLQVTQTT